MNGGIVQVVLAFEVPVDHLPDGGRPARQDGGTLRDLEPEKNGRGLLACLGIAKAPPDDP